MNIEQTLRILMGAFLVQGLLAIITWWPSGERSVESRDLVPVDASELTSITISGTVQRGETPDEPLSLERGSQGWILPSKLDSPVPEDKLKPLFEIIDRFEVRRPIAENAYRHADLDVAGDQHARKLVLTTEDGDTLTILVGSASGSAAHVRLDGDNRVYRVSGATPYGISISPTNYFDNQVLAVSASAVEELTVRRADGNAFTFTRTEGEWTVSVPAPPGRTLDSIQADGFVSRILNFKMVEPLANEVKPEMGLDQGTEVTWTTTEEGSTVTGRFVVGAEIDESGKRYVRVDGRPYIYEVMASQVENATTKPLEPLFKVQ